MDLLYFAANIHSREVHHPQDQHPIPNVALVQFLSPCQSLDLECHVCPWSECPLPLHPSTPEWLCMYNQLFSFQVLVPWCSPVGLRALFYPEPFMPFLELNPINVSGLLSIFWTFPLNSDWSSLAGCALPQCSLPDTNTVVTAASSLDSCASIKGWLREQTGHWIPGQELHSPCEPTVELRPERGLWQHSARPMLCASLPHHLFNLCAACHSHSSLVGVLRWIRQPLVENLDLKPLSLCRVPFGALAAHAAAVCFYDYDRPGETPPPSHNTLLIQPHSLLCALFFTVSSRGKCRAILVWSHHLPRADPGLYPACGCTGHRSGRLALGCCLCHALWVSFLSLLRDNSSRCK